MRWSLRVAPLSRSPWDRKGSRALDRYGKKLERALGEMTPWDKPSHWDRLVMRKKMMDAGMVDPAMAAKQKQAADLSASLWKSMTGSKGEKPNA